MVSEWEAPATAGEEVANSVIHIVGSHLGAAMIALLVWQSVYSGVDLGWKITSGCIFGFTVILLYAISSAYHAVMYKPAKDVLNILDHMAIYFLIAGTYTPFCLVTLRSTGHAVMGWTIFGVEWAAVLVGVLVKVWNTGKYRSVHSGIHSDGMGCNRRHRATCQGIAHYRFDVAGVGRIALYRRLCVLSLEGASVPSSHLASFCAVRFVVPFLLHTLARDVIPGILT